MDNALYRLHAELEETYWWWVAKNRIILSVIDRYFWPGHSENTGAKPRALDIGCGCGGILARLAERFDAVGIDMSPIARDYCAKRGLMAVDGSLPDALPFRDPGTFDVIVLSEVVEHVEQDRASIQAVTALLKPGGLLICTVPAHMWLWSSHDDFNFHQRRYTRRGFGALFDGLPLERIILSYYQCASFPLLVAGRAAEGIRSKFRRTPSSAPEIKPLPRPVNWMLTRAFEFEKHILPHARMPWGTSVISVHRRAAR